ncbi:d-tyrosyl-trna deacylase [Phaffia rhodozyma]|uniref:D-aminoacyl-tRNA deacylase n=1 Tax=Phaffia rhodozyma TaxID=264483 RepID=A0A0F7SE67_PHARH|nr:d-tyrosyl-trna deacylase [Phaffia rhodozyma]
MKAVVTKVINASVTVDNKVISQINNGLLALIGISKDDTPADLKLLVAKLLSLRIFESPDGQMWKASVKDVGGEILCGISLSASLSFLSQFTLQARTQRGTKPDFHMAMNPADAQKMYDDCLAALGKNYDPSKIKDGAFGAMMQVASINDGPITIILDTKATQVSSSASSSQTRTPNEAGTPNGQIQDSPGL